MIRLEVSGLKSFKLNISNSLCGNFLITASRVLCHTTVQTSVNQPTNILQFYFTKKGQYIVAIIKTSNVLYDISKSQKKKQKKI